MKRFSLVKQGSPATPAVAGTNLAHLPRAWPQSQHHHKDKTTKEQSSEVAEATVPKGQNPAPLTPGLGNLKVTGDISSH